MMAQVDKRIVPNPNLLNMRQGFEADHKDVFWYTDLDKNDSEYQEISRLAGELTDNASISKVNNPYLDMSFKIAQELKYFGTEPLRLFHATKSSCVDSICKNNFDWRLAGTATGHRHGYGVNFTSSYFFSRYFGETGETRVTIVADILTKRYTTGNLSTLRVPPSGYDAANDKNVFIKFDDAEFCPRYVIRDTRGLMLDTWKLN